MRRNRKELETMLYFQAWELVRKGEEKQVRKADLQERIWAGKQGGSQNESLCPCPTFESLEENPRAG